MAFKMKAGKEGPMKKNFPAAFKVDLDEVTVTAKAPRVPVLRQGFIYKNGEYFKEASDPSLEPRKVKPSDAIRMKLKSQVKKGGTTLNAMTGGVKTSMNDEINDVVIPTKRKTKEK